MRRLLLACVLCLQVALPAAGEEPTVIVLSLDGIRHDYLERTEIPALGRMIRDGAHAERMIPPFPSSTFPAHVSMATGTHPDRHGIVGNAFYDRKRGWYRYSPDASWLEAEPIWAAAERQGVRSAVFFWVASETDWHGVGASYRKAPFDGNIGEAEKVDQILEWIDLPDAERPRLIMSWWHGCDSIGHRKGPEHADIAEQLRSQDAQLARLFAGLDERQSWPHTTLLVVSDHGMVEVNHVLGVRSRLREAGIEATLVPLAGSAHVFLAEIEKRPEAAKVLAAVEGIQVLTPDEIPERLRVGHAQRTGDLLLLTEPPNTFFEPTTTQQLLIGAATLIGWKSGMHGYDPELPEMSTVFLALGQAIPAGESLGTVHSIDVAPTVAGLLGIEPPRHSEGTDLFAGSPALEAP